MLSIQRCFVSSGLFYIIANLCVKKETYNNTFPVIALAILLPADQFVGGWFRYFRHGSLYGAACFERVAVATEGERGARMKSVGLLSASYAVLHRHLPFLQSQVR